MSAGASDSLFFGAVFASHECKKREKKMLARTCVLFAGVNDGIFLGGFFAALKCKKDDLKKTACARFLFAVVNDSKGEAQKGKNINKLFTP